MIEMYTHRTGFDLAMELLASLPVEFSALTGQRQQDTGENKSYVHIHDLRDDLLPSRSFNPKAGEDSITALIRRLKNKGYKIVTENHPQDGRGRRVWLKHCPTLVWAIADAKAYWRKMYGETNP